MKHEELGQELQLKLCPEALVTGVTDKKNICESIYM